MGGGWFLVSGRGCAGRERVDEEGRERKTGHGDDGVGFCVLRVSGVEGAGDGERRERKQGKEGVLMGTGSLSEQD